LRIPYNQEVDHVLSMEFVLGLLTFLFINDDNIFSVYMYGIELDPRIPYDKLTVDDIYIFESVDLLLVPYGLMLIIVNIGPI
jgi:hypothetical protein